MELSARGRAVLRLTAIEQGDTPARPAALWAGLVSITCLVRGLPLCFGQAPATPLRVLCIVALDTVHVLRHSRALSRQRRQDLGTFLDFQACTNAWWDRKPLCAAHYQALRQRLEEAGLGPWVTEYLDRLSELETRRPAVGGDRRRFDEVRSYREAVGRLALASLAAIALNAARLEDAIRSTYCESDVAALYRMAMQCQIIDDVVDFRADLAASLPSFLTASASLPQALALTTDAARFYGAPPQPSAGGGVFPLDAALSVLTAVTTLVVAVGGRGALRNKRVPTTAR
jgi:hypothetical protein